MPDGRRLLETGSPDTSVERRRAEDAARENREQMQDLLDSAALGMHFVGPDGVILWANQAELDLLGYTRGEYVGHHIAEFHSDRQAIDTILARLASHETLRDHEARLRCKDGSIKHVVIDSNVLWRDETFIHTRCFTRDITAQKRTAHLLALQHAITRVLAESDGLSDAAPNLIRAVCDSADWQVGALWRVDETANQLRCLEFSNCSPEQFPRFEAVTRNRAFLPGIGLPGRIWSSGEAAWIPDVTRDSNFPRAHIASAEGLHGAFAFPITVGREVSGVMEFFSRRTRQSEPELLELLAGFGRQIGQFAERKQTEERLRTTEARFRGVVQQTNAGIAQTDLAGHFVLVNDRYCVIVGRSREELLGGLTMQDITHPDDLSRNLEPFQKLVSGDGPDFVIEKRYVRPDGSHVWVNNSVSVVRDTSGRAQFALAAVVDVTERKQAEEAVRAREHQMAAELAATQALQDVSIQMIQEGDVNGLYQQILDAAVAIMRADMASIQIVDEDQDALRMLAFRGFEPAFGEIFALCRPDTKTSCSVARRLGQRVVVSDVETCDFIVGTPALEDHRKTGIQAAQSTPLLSRSGRLLGMISTHWRQPHQPSDRNLRLLDVLARQAGDLIERNHAEEALRTSTVQLRAAAERLQDEVRIVETLNRVGANVAAELNPDRVVQTVTDAATELTMAQFGAFFYNVIDPQSGEAFLLYTLSGASKEAFAAFPKPRATQIFGPTFRGEAVVRLDDVTRDPRYGKSAPYHGMPAGHLPVRSYLAVPVVAASGEVLGGLFFGHSQPGVFTERHERLAVGIAGWAAVALENARLYRQAQEANRLKDEFLATLSHELRTPLNAMLGWSHMLRVGTLKGDAAARALNSIERNARVQAQLVEDLLDVSRIISGKLPLKTEPVDLTGAITSAIEAVRAAAIAKNIELQVELDQTAASVIGDSARLQQVIWNLLTNAVKFTPSGGRIDVRLDRADGQAQVTVRDTGQGIPPDFLPHVFERFRQQDATTSRKHGGLGLGLSIVRYLTEAHGGTVSVSSPGEGRGATFTLWLPLSHVRQEADRAAAPEHPRPSLSGVRVLVVDDEADARELLTLVLEGCGADVLSVGSAGEALHVLSRDQLDILLADIGMPDRDGYDLIRAIRELPPEMGGTIHAVAVTAYASLRERDEALAAGYNWHVAKPVDPDYVAGIVAQAAGRVPGN